MDRDQAQAGQTPAGDGMGPDEAELDPGKTTGPEASQDDDRSDAG